MFLTKKYLKQFIYNRIFIFFSFLIYLFVFNVLADYIIDLKNQDHFHCLQVSADAV